MKDLLNQIKAMFFATDKLLHMGACYVITMVIAAILHRNPWAIGIGALAALLIGLGKEIGDSVQPGNKFDWKDILADVIGIAVAAATYGVMLI